VDNLWSKLKIFKINLKKLTFFSDLVIINPALFSVFKNRKKRRIKAKTRTSLVNFFFKD